MRRRLLPLVAAGVLLASACGPKAEVQVGLNDYSTDIVFGAKKKAPEPALAPAADLTPAFPGFIQPPPVVPVASNPAVATTLAPRPVACPEAGVFEIPPEAPADVAGRPKAGVYPYRVAGTSRVGNVTVPFPAEQRRTVTHITAADPTWQVAVPSGDGVVTTTYSVRRPAGSPSLAGIYVTHVVLQRRNGATEEFAPVSPGLRLFALPADLGTRWTSVATDAVHATGMRLEGLITQKRRVNACGTVVEGWEADVVAEIIGIGPGEKRIRITAKYLVATGLGGLIVEDAVNLEGTDRTTPVAQQVRATINRIEPLR